MPERWDSGLGVGQKEDNDGAKDISKRMFITVPFVMLKNWKQPKCSEIINEFIICPSKHVKIITDHVIEEYLMPCKKFSQYSIK